MFRVRRYALALVACCLALFGSSRPGWLSVNAASEYTLQFDGVDDRVTFGSGSVFGATNFTLELWFKKQGAGVATSTGTGGITAVPLITKGMAQADGSTQDANYFLGIDSATKVLAADFEDFNTGLNHPVLGKTIICDNIWYHAAVTYDSTTGTWRMYLNGDLETELVISGTGNVRVPRFDSIQWPALGTALQSTGAVSGQTQGFFKGQMDEARIWNVARSQADIRSAMGSPLLIAQAGLLARFGLDDGSGLVALNSAGATNGTLSGGATPPVFIAGGSGYASTPVIGNQGIKLAPTSATVGDYVSFGAATSTLGAATFTVEARFKREGAGFTTNTGTGGVVAIPLVTKGTGEAEGSNRDMNYFLGISSAGVITADFEEGATGASPGMNHPISGVTQIPISSTVWWHAAVTYDGTTLRLYLNGVPEGTPVTVGQPPRSDSIQHAALGAALTSTGIVSGSSGFFAGTIDEARIWNYARTAPQILAGAGREISTAPGLLGRWGFNECCGRIADTSGHLPLATAVAPAMTWVPTPDLLSVVNTAPSVDAGFDSFAAFPTAALTGSVVDDGVDTGASLTSVWSKTSGPGTVTFAAPASPITTATFSTVGTYVLTLTANDGELTGSDSVTIQVQSTGTNLPPTANAGPDQIITFPGQASLTGSYMDDGLPGFDVDTTWSVVSGPGTVTIAQPFELNTTATFSATGTYVLKLTADDTALSASDTVVITVNAPATNFAVDLNGTNAYATMGVAPGLGASVFTLEAWVKREGTGIATSTGTGGITAIPIVTKGMAQADGSNLDMNYFLGIDSTTGVLAADFEEGATGASPGLNHPVKGATPVSSNVWHHVAATYDGNAWRLYLDGTFDNVGGQPLVVGRPPRADSIQHAAIGTALGSGGVVGSGTQGFFNGVIDEVRIWNVARSQSEIQGGMSGEVSSDPTLLGRWGFNEGTGVAPKQVADGSGHGIIGTVNGTFAWVPGVPFTAPNHAPDAPIVGTPSVAATGVASPATLNVSVSDSDGDPLTVTYYGRKKQTTAPDFTYVTIPDTQHYVDNATFPGTFTAQTNWIVANKTPMNIAFVSQLGDLTEHLDAQPIEWTRADTSMQVLDNDGIPYGTAPGNHDQSATGVAAMYDLTFPVSRYLGKPWYLGYLGMNTGEIQRFNKDNYEEFTVGNLKFLVIHIELDWPAYAVTWADQVIKSHPNHRIILSSHLFVNTSNVRPTTAQFRTSGPVAEQGTSAEAVWQQIIKSNCNVFMVVNGHYPGEGRRTDLNDCGKPVHQVLMDYQSRANGGDGWLRYLRFQPAQNKISAFTYSVTRHEFEADADSQFDLDYDMQGTPFAVIGTQTGIPSGPSSVVWPGLEAGAQYEWYATVNDGKQTTTGAMWNFTTAAANAAPVAIDDGYNVDEDQTLSVPAPGVLSNDTDVNHDALSAVLVNGTQHGSLTFNADGSFTYTPDTDYHGADSFTYKANDAALDSNVATVLIGVEPINDAPVAANDAFFVDEDQTLTVAAPGVLANDSDADGGNLQVLPVGDPAHGMLTLNADGSFTYTPDPNFTGSDLFTYRANDGSADSNVATVSIAIEPVNDAPVAVNDGYSAAEDTPLTVGAPGVLANDTDAEGNSLTATLVTSPAHGALMLGADGGFVYTPAADSNGPDSFTYKANDGTTDSSIATVTIAVSAVNDAPVAVNDSFSTAEDTPLTIAAPAGVLANDTDVDGGSLTATIATAPANGGVMLNADGSFTYTPNANFNGSDSFSYKANDGTADSNVATVAIAVTAVNDAPVAVNDSFSTAEDTSLTIAAPAGVLANDTDTDGNSLTAIVATAPANGTVTLNADGSFTYAPNVNFNGSDSFTYRANDGTADSNVATVAITVTAVNDAPVAANDNYTAAEDTPLTIAAPGLLANDSDVDGDSLTAIVATSPANGTLTLNADGSFAYTPNANFSGSDAFSYRANDGTTDSNTATVTIAVSAVNDAPVAGNDSYSTAEDTALTIAGPGVLGNDTDVDGNSLTAIVATSPANGTLTLNADGSFTYTPNANFSGSDVFGYRANDGTTDSNTATVTIAVSAVNDAPVAGNDSYSTAEDTALTIAGPGVLGNDTDVDGNSLTAIVATSPANGTLTLNADGSFTYTPNANFSGSDVFSYRANDGTTDSNTATVTIAVSAVNDAPVAGNDSYSTAEDTALTIAGPGVLGNDTDVDGNSLTAIVATSPANGTLTLNADGSFAYTPNANFSGNDAFSYRANDGTTDSNTATVTIAVSAVNDAPVAGNDSYSTAEDTALTIAGPGVLGNDTDVDGNSLTAIVVTPPAKGTLTLNANGSFTYTPNANVSGSDSFTYRANDGATNSNIATVTIAVSAVNDPPKTQNDSASGNEDTTITGNVLANDSDVDGDTLTASLLTGVSHGSVTLNGNGLFSYTPTANYCGPDGFTYNANDGHGGSTPASVSITVVCVNDAPKANDDAASTLEDTAVAGTVLSNDTDIDSSITARLVSGPSNGGVMLNSNGSFVYTPNANFFGTDSFTYAATDGEFSATATVTIQVTPINDAPVAGNDAATTAEDLGVDIAVLANDSDIDSPTVRIASNTSPAHGSVTVNTDGTITYTPDANFNGTDTFTYRVTDGSLLSAPATVTVTVKSANDAPVAQNSFISTAEDAPISAHVLVSDSDSATLTVTRVTAPTHGTLTLSANGAFTYVPAPNYNGPDSFTFKASDGALESNIGTVNIAVAPVDDAPICSAATPSISEIWPPNHQMVPVTINGVTDLDSPSIGISITGIYQDEPTNATGDGNTPSDASGVGMSFAQVRGERSGTPKVPGNGRVYHIQFRASDGALSCTGEVKVGVPHDQGNKRTLIDDGIKFNSVTGATVP